MASLAMHAQDFVVPTDGTFADAIHAANTRADKTRRYVIHVRQGVHLSQGDGDTITHVLTDAQGRTDTLRLPSPMLRLTAPLVTIQGEGMDRTVIENRPVQEGISITSTLFVDHADSTCIQDLTLWCNFPHTAQAPANRSVALRERGCRGNRLQRVRLLSTQDTYYTNAGGDTHLTDCEIHGTVDFICGGGTVFFDHCHIVLEPRAKAGNRDVICAPATADAEGGYLFAHCTITGSPQQDGRYHLARPWKNRPTCVWLYTSMHLVPDAVGYSEMHGTLPGLFAEYGSTDRHGHPVDFSRRRTSYRNADGVDTPVQHAPVLNDAEAREWLQRFTTTFGSGQIHSSL